MDIEPAWVILASLLSTISLSSWRKQVWNCYFTPTSRETERTVERHQEIFEVIKKIRQTRSHLLVTVPLTVRPELNPRFPHALRLLDGRAPISQANPAASSFAIIPNSIKPTWRVQPVLVLGLSDITWHHPYKHIHSWPNACSDGFSVVLLWFPAVMWDQVRCWSV